MDPLRPHGAGSLREAASGSQGEGEVVSATSAGGVLVIQPPWQEGLLWGLGMPRVWRRGLLRSREPQRITPGGGGLCLKALS